MKVADDELVHLAEEFLDWHEMNLRIAGEYKQSQETLLAAYSNGQAEAWHQARRKLLAMMERRS
jgi:hypothetical protein